MVHTIIVRPDGRVLERLRPWAPQNARRSKEPQRAHRYVLVPDGLILAFAHDPLAVGVYVAIARFVMAAKDSVPLAARDLAAWMGSDREADRAAIMRRISKLEERGWVMISRTTATKHRLLPTWGRDQLGTVRPWRMDQASSGRPSHVRGRRVPLGLLDDYVGRFDPQPGHAHALISRYFTRPLLDLTDIGVYTIGLRAEIAPTLRLSHLTLYEVGGMAVPLDGQSLLELAAANQLTTIVGDVVAVVQLSIQGKARLGMASSTFTLDPAQERKDLRGSTSRSGTGSKGRSIASSHPSTDIRHQDALAVVPDLPQSLIAWDVGKKHEQTNHDSPPNPMLANGGGSTNGHDNTGAVIDALDDCLAMSADPHTCPEQLSRHPISCLAASLVAGHRALNAARQIDAGEWHELLALQQTYGVDQLLIWQARARRVRAERPNGIAPGYYRACAARAACEAYLPRTHEQTADSLASSISHVVPPPSRLDPDCDALLRAIGVRERHKLSAVPYALIAAWQEALAHPGLAAQFTSPIGFAVAQMRRGNAPPPLAELDFWAERASRKDDRYESWRYAEAATITQATIAHEQQLEARVRAIAPPDADPQDLCELACWIESGATDAEALAYLRATRTGDWDEPGS